MVGPLDQASPCRVVWGGTVLTARTNPHLDPPKLCRIITLWVFIVALGHCLTCFGGPDMPQLPASRPCRIFQHFSFSKLTPDSAHKVQVTYKSGFWFQKPYPSWFGVPESVTLGYLDPLGCCSLTWMQFCGPTAETSAQEIERERGRVSMKEDILSPSPKVHRSEDYPQAYTPPPPNKDQLRRNGMIAGCLGLIRPCFGRGCMAGGSIRLYEKS